MFKVTDIEMSGRRKCGPNTLEAATERRSYGPLPRRTELGPSYPMHLLPLSTMFGPDRRTDEISRGTSRNLSEIAGHPCVCHYFDVSPHLPQREYSFVVQCFTKIHEKINDLLLLEWH